MEELQDGLIEIGLIKFGCNITQQPAKGYKAEGYYWRLEIDPRDIQNFANYEIGAAIDALHKRSINITRTAIKSNAPLLQMTETQKMAMSGLNSLSWKRVDGGILGRHDPSSAPTPVNLLDILRPFPVSGLYNITQGSLFLNEMAVATLSRYGLESASLMGTVNQQPVSIVTSVISPETKEAVAELNRKNDDGYLYTWIAMPGKQIFKLATLFTSEDSARIFWNTYLKDAGVQQPIYERINSQWQIKLFKSDMSRMADNGVKQAEDYVGRENRFGNQIQQFYQ